MNLGLVAFSNVGMAKSCHYLLDIIQDLVACVTDTETHQDQHGEDSQIQFQKILPTSPMKSRHKQTNFIPFLFCYLTTFHCICSDQANILFLDKLHNNISRSLGVLPYAFTNGTKFPKSILHKIIFSKRITALLTFRKVKISARKIHLPLRGLLLSKKIGKLS